MGKARSLRAGIAATGALCCGLFGVALSCRSSPPAAQELAPRGHSGDATAPAASPRARATGSAAASAAAHAEPLPKVPSSPALVPLTAPSPFVTLPVPGFRDAVVSVPLGATEPRIVAVALHGNFDRPEWQCQVWRQITQAEVFVLCPRGIPRTDVSKQEDRWEWGSVAKTKAELVAALGALRERFGSHIRSGPIVFTGFSLGAILGARMLQDPELGIGAAVLTEGGYAGWTSAKAKTAASSLSGVLFACGQTDCRNKLRQSLPMFEKAGLKVTLVAEVKAGHTYDGPVADAIQAEWPALLRGLNEARPTLNPSP